MASRPAWDKAGAVLRMTYGRLAHRDALNALYRTLNDLDDERLLAAVERHLDDDTQEHSGSLVGNWLPKPAQIRFHANALQVEADVARRAELEARAETLNRVQAEASARVVEFPSEHAGMFGVKDMHLVATKCRECCDGGMTSYFIPRDLSHPANKYRVFEEDEFLKLPPAIKDTLQRFSAVCDCPAGKLKRETSNGHRVQNMAGRDRRLYILVEEVRKMAHKRREKEDTGHGVGAEVGT